MRLFLVFGLMFVAMNSALAAKKINRDLTQLRWPAASEELTCVGTEPFWTLKLSESKVTFDDASGKKTDLGKATVSSPIGVGTGVRIYRAGQKLQAFVESQQLWIVAKADGSVVGGGDSGPKAYCSDGMSELLYPFAVHFSFADKNYFGCCSTKSNPTIGHAGE